MDKRFNVLHIMADQLTATALRVYGNKVCRTPHIESLAARGTLFENHYCNFPLCAPSRVSMLTGRLASRDGVYDNACDFPSQTPTLPYYLGALGYHTCLAGKMHFIGADQLHGYQERLTTDIYPSDFGWTPDWKQSIPGNRAMSLSGVVEAGTCKRSLQLDYDDEVAARSLQWIYDYRRQANAKPFFFTASFTHPHSPYVIAQEYWDRYQEAEIDMPRVGPIPYDKLDAHSKRLWQVFKYGQYNITPEDVRRARHAYYGMISYIDDQVGKLLGALRDMDLEENTVVIFTSDHGDMVGERGLWYKWMHFENASRVPLIICVPGQKPLRVSAPVSLLDLLPTVLDIATGDGPAIEPVSELEGESLLAAVLGKRSLLNNRPVFGEMTADGTFSPSFMVRKSDWKYVSCEGDPPLLFNLRNDPDERENLAGTNRAAEVEGEMQKLVDTNWSPEAVKNDMRQSARRRTFIKHARNTAGSPPWDYQPRKEDASKQYVRGGGTVGATKAKARYPFVPAKPPDNPE
jgi:choline-sulfatase